LGIRASPDPAPSGSLVRFSVDLAGPSDRILSGFWFFGDGGSAVSEVCLTAEHMYSAPGNYTVRLRVETTYGAGGDFFAAVTVLNLAPVALGEVRPSEGTALTLFTFSSRSEDADGRVVRTRWDFGDGAASDSPSPTHTYSRHGVFAVNLTVQDELGLWSAPVSFQVVVKNTPPSVIFGEVKGTRAPGMKLSFNASGTVDIDDPPGALAFSWDFGDGASAKGPKASHVYSRAGRFAVTLTVDDGAGGISTKTATVEVRQATGPEVGWQMSAAVAGALLAVSIIIYIIIRILTHRHEGHGPEAGNLPGKPPKKR